MRAYIKEGISAFLVLLIFLSLFPLSVYADQTAEDAQEDAIAEAEEVIVEEENRMIPEGSEPEPAEEEVGEESSALSSETAATLSTGGLPLENGSDEQETAEETVEAETETFCDPDSEADNDALFQAYFESLLRPRLRRPVGPSNLSDVDLTVYSLLADHCNTVAQQGGSTVFALSLLDLGVQLSWTQEELGGITILSDGKITAEAKSAVSERLVTADTSLVISALQQDYPYGMYWYDKRTGVSVRTSYKLSATSKSIQISSGTVTYSLAVSVDYGSDYVVDSDQVSRAHTAAENARAIVSTFAEYPDDEKLLAYKEEICSLTSYNYEAAHGGYPYGDPWQAIYVFDGDPSTTVVCEGYSKAFEYLCDISMFVSPEISCVSVMGWMGSENHMWNLVTLADGKNYLADVTNSDSGTIGASGDLFLTGYSSGNIWDGYDIACGSSFVRYVYNSSTKAVMTEPELTLVPAVAVDPALELHDTIGIKFYVTPAEGMDLSSMTANVSYTSKYQTVDNSYKLSELTPVSGEYLIKAIDAASDEMSDTVTLTVKRGSAELFRQDYSIASIAGTWLETERMRAYWPLLRAMLQYGDKAQGFFGNHPDQHITPDGAPALVPIPAAYAPGADPTALADYIEYCQFAINLETAVGMSIYIKPKAGYGIDDISVTITDQNGKAVAATAPALVDSEIKITIPGLYPEQLLNNYSVTVTVNGVSATYVRSVISCAYALEQRGAAVELVEALYQYSLAAQGIWG